VLRPAPSPNVCCHGLYRGWCTLQVHQGLLDTLTDADELQAALAHEIVHVKRFDTLFFTCLRPLLWISRVILGLLRILTLLLGRGVRQGGLPRINLLGPLQKMLFGGIEGMIMVLAGMMMLAMLAALAMFFLTYALLLVGCLVAFSLAGLAYCRHLERTADLAAAQLLGDGDAMLLSLARCGHAIGSERGQLDLFASLHLGGGNYSLLDILRCLKAGGDPAAGVDWKLRLFRSHPLLLERLSQIMRAYGTSLV
jgi:Zn-dependent protease with chaperone function